MARPVSYPIEETQHSPALIVCDEHSIEQYFPCEKCKEFWSHITGSTNPGHSRHILNIKAQFERNFPFVMSHEHVWRKIWKIIQKFLIGYRSYLNVGNEEIIELRQFLCLIRHFGCVKRHGDSCFLISNIQYLVEHGGVIKNRTMQSWFAGHTSKDEASRLLVGEDKGTFLVRFSETYMEKGGFAVSIKGEETGEVHHYIIETSSTCCHENHYDGQFQLLVNNDTDEDDHPDLVTFVDQRLRADYVEGLECNHICPDLKYNADFTGYRNTA